MVLNDGLRNLNVYISPIKSTTLRWVRHLSRMGEMRNAHKGLVRKSEETKTSFGFLFYIVVSSWLIYWINLAHDSVQ